MTALLAFMLTFSEIVVERKKLFEGRASLAVTFIQKSNSDFLPFRGNLIKRYLLKANN